MCALGLCQAALVVAASYPLPAEEFNLVGDLEIVQALPEDTLLDIARRHDVGQEAILLANPDVDRWLPGAGTEVVIPTRHILPPGPFEGIVLNLPEMRLYYYPNNDTGPATEVRTYPISVGRMDWGTPLGDTTLVNKQQDPPWHPPESIRKEHAEQGDPLPRVVPPGPDNPLGRHALRLGIPGYLIHGTNKVFGVGMRVSHGCIRMLPEDVAELFELAPVGTPVRIINQVAKAGWYGGELYLEVHPPLEEDQVSPEILYEAVMAELDREVFKRPTTLDAEAIDRAITQPTGMPVVVSAKP
jgi:L,D-transpeptidase ErfK/SrfK